MLISVTNAGHQYFIGSFDGKKFTKENSKNTTLWLDSGPDSIAAIPFNDLPDGRRIIIGWMGSWEVAGNLERTNESSQRSEIDINW